MESFEMRILRLILTELLNAGRIKEGDTLNESNTVHNAAISMVYALGMGNGDVHSDSSIKIECTRTHYIVSIDNTQVGDDRHYTSIYIPHPPTDTEQTNFDFICCRLVETVCHYEHHYRHNTDTPFMQRMLDTQLSSLCSIKKPALDKPLTLGEGVLLYALGNEYVIKVHDEVFYRTPIVDVEDTIVR